jgi:hypothetical protein
MLELGYYVSLTIFFLSAYSRGKWSGDNNFQIIDSVNTIKFLMFRW